MLWPRHLATLTAIGLTAVVAPAQQEAEILRDGVTAGGRRPADVRVVGATIAEVGPGLAARDANTQEIDARGWLVLPGGIDPHVHLGGNRAEDYTTGSAAALAAAGQTTIKVFMVRPSFDQTVPGFIATTYAARETGV